jgi:hypothetical protein
MRSLYGNKKILREFEVKADRWRTSREHRRKLFEQEMAQMEKKPSRPVPPEIVKGNTSR